MDTRTKDLLEFSYVLAQLRGFTRSHDASFLLETQQFFTDQKSLNAFLDEVKDYRHLLSLGEKLHMSWSDISQSLKILRIEGSVLEGLDLYNVASYIKATADLSLFIRKQAAELKLETCSILNYIFELPDFGDLSAEILHLILSDGTVNESRVPELSAIRKKIAKTHNDIQHLSSGYLQNSPSLWQTDVATQKDGRIVLPLKSNFKGKVQGIIHGVSNKGATLFIEPFDIVEKNNQITELENEYQQIVLRIYRDFTKKLRNNLNEIVSMKKSVAYLDTIYARACYSLEYSCNRILESSGEIILSQARHPELGSAAVPISLHMHKETKVLIITGPNTGGKTVSLKTVGLFAMMNQFGMYVPAAEGSTLPVFDNVFADIGDDQSIMANLSTFSAHIQNISRILREKTEQSLVLLDELGSGTAPEEGSAIAMAILDDFIHADTWMICTTHLGALKSYAYQHDSVSNASMAFDTQKLIPTYEILPGIPGESHALDIAEKNGLPISVLKSARMYRHDNKTDIAKIIEELSKEKSELDEQAKLLRDKEYALREALRRAELKLLQLKQKEAQLKDETVTKLYQFLSESRKDFEKLVREIREGKLNKDQIKTAQDIFSAVENTIEIESEKLDVPSIAADSEIYEGITVLAGTVKRQGKVLRKEKGQLWLVDFGNMRMSLKADDLIPICLSKEKKFVSVQYQSVSSSTASFELDIRGLRAEDALQRLVNQLDKAVLSGMKEFSIIHGKGEGVLQKLVRDELQQASVVSHFSFARPEDGGFGKTIVYLS